MATALKLRADIKKYEAALKSKATPQSLKAKLEKQLEKAKGDLADMRVKKPTEKKAKKGDLPKQFGAYKGSGVDIKKDSERPAKPVGKRKSKSGKTYYEYRLNRIDIKQPPRKYPKLEKGGMMSEGGVADELYVAEYRKGEWTVKDKKNPKGNYSLSSNKQNAENFRQALIDSPSKLKYYRSNEYASGGMMSEGGKYAVGGSIISTKYEKIEGTDYELKIKIFYTTYKQEPRGYYLLISPVKREKDNGYMTESYMPNLDVRTLILPVQKESPKAEKEAHEIAEKMMPEIKSFISEKIQNKKLAEGGAIPEGYHQMPDGSMMADSAHMAKGGYMEKGGVIYLKSVGTYFKPSDMTTSPEKEFKNEGEINYIYENSDEWWESLSDSDKKIIESYKMKYGGMMANGGELSKEDFLKKSIVYDNGGESLDRYTVYTPDGSVYGMSETGAGFNQYLGEADEIPQGKHLGKKLKSVPKEIESEILSRMEYADGGMMAKGGKVGKKEFSAYTILNADEYGYRNSEGKMKPTKFYIVWYGNEYKLWMEDDNKYRVKFNDDDELKKAIDKVRYRLPQDQKFFKEFIVSEKFEYADGGMMAKGGYMEKGGELHRMDEAKMEKGGEMKSFSEKEFKQILDESLEPLYMGLNKIDESMRYLELKGQGGLRSAFAKKIGLDDLKGSIEKIDEYVTKK